MTATKKETIKKTAEKIDKLSEDKKLYVQGVIDGMSIAQETAKKEGS